MKVKKKLNKNDAVSMREAVALVLEGQPLREVGKRKNIPFQTLHRYVKKQKSSDVPIRMTTEQENCLVNYIKTCSKMFYGLPMIECRRLAYEMAIHNNVSVPENWKTKKMAGEKWMRLFMKRHPTLSLRTPEGCSLARATAFNKFNVGTFFDKLEECYTRNPKFVDGTRLYNLDETATMTNQKLRAKVIAERGSQQVSKVTSGEKGILVTTCMIVSAAGNWIPPALIFPRVHFQNRMLREAPPGTLGLATKSGWMTRDTFIEVMKHFIKHSGSSKDNPSLLLCDNHDSHISIQALNLAKENGITILTFPPHSTHKLQPLDVGIFGPFQKYYDSAVDSWMMHHPGERFSIYEVAECVGKAHEKALMPETITKAFKATGIRPFDRHIFNESDFLCSSVTDQLPAEDTEAVNEGTSSDHLSQPEIPGNLNENPTPSNVPSTPPSMCDKQQLELSTSTVISPVEFRGYPKSKPRKANRKPRRKGKCMIATDTPEKNEIQEYRERQSRLKKRGAAVIKKIGAETNKQPIKKKKAIILDDTSDSESLPDLSSDTEISEEDFENTLSQNFEELQRDPIKEDYVLVQFKARGTNVFYVGRVINDVNENNEIEVSFLRKSSKLQGNFITPNIADISFVPIEDVKIILPKPTNFGQTKRQNSYLSFEINFGELDVR